MIFVNTLNVYNLYKVCVLSLCKLHKALSRTPVLLRLCLVRTYVLFAPLTQELAKTNSQLPHLYFKQNITLALYCIKVLQECRVINICAFLHIKNTEHMFYTQIRRAATHRAPSNYVCYCYVLCIIIVVCYYVLCIIMCYVILLLLLLMCYYVLYVIMCCIILLLSLFVCCCYVSLSLVVCCWWCIACYVSFVEGARLMRVSYERPKLPDVP